MAVAMVHSLFNFLNKPNSTLPATRNAPLQQKPAKTESG